VKRSDSLDELFEDIFYEVISRDRGHPRCFPDSN